MNGSEVHREIGGGSELELFSAYDDRKLYELDIFEAIEREKHIRRDKDDVKRFSVGLYNHLTDEIDSIEDKKNYSEELIRSTLITHGLSIINWKLGSTIDEIGNMRMELVNCDVDEIRDRVSSLNTVVYERQLNAKRRSVTIPKNVTGSLNKIAKIMFLDSSTFYQVCMAYSLYTRPCIIQGRKAHFGEQRNKFVVHARSQYILFKGMKYMLEESCTDEFKCKFDIDGDDIS